MVFNSLKKCNHPSQISRQQSVIVAFSSERQHYSFCNRPTEKHLFTVSCYENC